MEFVISAHRGASSYAPENTLASFYKAIELGANGIETDLRKTRDGIVFLFHDTVLDNKTNGKGSPSEHTWAELKQLDAGSWFSTRYKGERLLTFEEFLYYFGGRELVFDIELKVPFVEEEAKELIELTSTYGAREKVTFTSFIYDNLVTFRNTDSGIKIGYLLEKISAEDIEKLKSIDAQQICPLARLLTHQNVLYAKESGLRVRAWGIDNIRLMKHAFNCGVDGMTLDFPDKLVKLLNNS